MTNFYSIQFLIFLSVVLICYYTVFRKQQWVCLLIASAVFYAWTGIENFIFLFLTGVTTWGGAQLLARQSEFMTQLKKDKTIEKAIKDIRKAKIIRTRRIIMWSVVGINFGVLGYLKYFRVVLENIAGILGIGVHGSNLYQHVLGLVLPLGISFYMFQSIGYLLDVYYEKYPVEQHFAKYMLFVGYFPQMIQGPINRYDELGEEFAREHVWDSERSTKALYRIGYGLFKKYAIANIFSGVIAAIFDNPVRDYAGCMVLLGILLYSAQQYADFSGGIDMVIGVSELFDIHMMENFRQPYFATSLADFWRRWHISLGHWMRDYVFYPFALTKPLKNLGKTVNKKFGKHLGRVLPASLGNLLVFLIVGLWHGAQWHYIIWGLYNGMVIAFSDIFAPAYQKLATVLHVNTKAGWYRVFQIIRTFVVVNIGWYFDRITDIKVALYSLKKTIFDFNLSLFETEARIAFYDIPNYAVGLAVAACIFVFLISFLEECKIDVKEKIYTSKLVIRWSIYFFVIGMILVASMSVIGTGGFMYANF